MIGPDFDHFCQLILSRSGIVLTADKVYLVRSRLEPIARAEKLAGGAVELLGLLRRGAPAPLVQRCVDAMATHETYFFRDGAPFELLAKTVLPELIEARHAKRALRIWCAACSSGQEPYSVAMVLQELAHKMPGWRLEIVASDMSEPILAKARSGLYSDFEVKRGLSPERLQRGFVQQGDAWKVLPGLQQMVTFKPHNLLHGTASMGQFDLIMSRNVLIYFDVETKRRVLGELARSVAEDGYLFLGSAETVIGITDAFELTPGARGLFRRCSAQRAVRTA